MNRLGGGLIALIAVVVAYRPPATRGESLFDFGNMFLPLIMSIIAFLISVIGSVSSLGTLRMLK
jgi:hypothetical protein